MIQIKQCNTNLISVFTTEFMYDNTKSYTLKFVNDISLTAYTTPMIVDMYNSTYTSISVYEQTCNASTSGAFVLPNQGFYTLYILDPDSNTVYTERVQVTSDIQDDSDFIVIYEPDETSFCETLAQCTIFKDLATGASGVKIAEFIPDVPNEGGILYVDGGLLKFINSFGTITILT